MPAVRVLILGEPASKANSRELGMIGTGEKRRPLIRKSDKALEYERTAALQVPGAARVMLKGPVRVTVHVYYASERPDLDESVILDVLQAQFKTVTFPGGKTERQCIRRGVYVNDRQVREKHVFHHIDKGNPRAEILVEPMTMEQVEEIARFEPTLLERPRAVDSMLATFAGTSFGEEAVAYVRLLEQLANSVTRPAERGAKQKPPTLSIERVAERQRRAAMPDPFAT